MHLFHRWKLIEFTGFTCYEECRKCGRRRATQPASGPYQSGYQPIDRAWVEGQSKKPAANEVVVRIRAEDEATEVIRNVRIEAERAIEALNALGEAKSALK